MAQLTSSGAFLPDDACPICLNTFVSSKSVDQIIQTHCRHAFHDVCLRQWLATGNGRCPLCRQLLPPILESNRSHISLHHDASILDVRALSEEDENDELLMFGAEELVFAELQNGTLQRHQHESLEWLWDWQEQDLPEFWALDACIEELIIEERQLRAAVLLEGFRTPLSLFTL